MKEKVKDFRVIDLVDKDFGWKMGIKRPITLTITNCKMKKESITLQPNDQITLNPCEGKTISWVGTLTWDGRRLRK